MTVTKEEPIQEAKEEKTSTPAVVKQQASREPSSHNVSSIFN